MDPGASCPTAGISGHSSILPIFGSFFFGNRFYFIIILIFFFKLGSHIRVFHSFFKDLFHLFIFLCVSVCRVYMGAQEG